jgi:hypothetical protein
MPETPAPSSRTCEVGASREDVKRKFVGEESQVDRRGVMVQTTGMDQYGLGRGKLEEAGSGIRCGGLLEVVFSM